MAGLIDKGRVSPPGRASNSAPPRSATSGLGWVVEAQKASHRQVKNLGGSRQVPHLNIFIFQFSLALQLRFPLSFSSHNEQLRSSALRFVAGRKVRKLSFLFSNLCFDDYNMNNPILTSIMGTPK